MKKVHHKVFPWFLGPYGIMLCDAGSKFLPRSIVGYVNGYYRTIHVNSTSITIDQMAKFEFEFPRLYNTQWRSQNGHFIKANDSLLHDNAVNGTYIEFNIAASHYECGAINIRYKQSAYNHCLNDRFEIVDFSLCANYHARRIIHMGATFLASDNQWSKIVIITVKLIKNVSFIVIIRSNSHIYNSLFKSKSVRVIRI